MKVTHLDPLSQAVQDIATQGYAVVDRFLPSHQIAQLAEIVKAKWLGGQMVSAKTGKAKLKHESIRGDYIAWLEDGVDATEQLALDAYFRKMELMRLQLNMQLFMNVQELETHVALYPVGSVYQKHLDQFSHGATPQLQTRQLSAVLYLNKYWRQGHGGALRLYVDETEYVDLLPKAGRVVFFLSAKFWHEVLPATRERLSITGWFRTRDHAIL